MLFKGNVEALGWALEAVAGPINFIAFTLFLVTTTLNLAKISVGCEVEIPEGETRAPECHERVYGLRPSSLITLYATIVGLVTALTLPVVGAIIDHTPHRKRVGLVCTMLTVIGAVVANLFLSTSDWLSLSIVMLILAVIGFIRHLTYMSYLPELSDDSDLLMKWTAIFGGITYGSMVTFLICMIGVASIFDRSDDYEWSAKVATITSGCITFLLSGIVWTRLLKPRPALNIRPENVRLVTLAFKKVQKTLALLKKDFRGLMWFFIAVSVAEAGLQALTSIIVTYMLDTLLMNTTEVGIAVLCLMVFGTFGTFIASVLPSLIQIDPIRSMQLSMILTQGTTVIAPFILIKPGQQVETYIIAGVLGIGSGWRATVEKFILCRIIPKGQHAEMMGFYIFSMQILIWLPTLIFTLMNEAGISQRVGIGVLSAFFCASAFALTCMGPFEKLEKLANDHEEEKEELDDADLYDTI